MGYNFKRVLAIVLAATCMLVFSFSATFAATGSPKDAKNQKGTKDGLYTTTQSGEAYLTGLYKKNIKDKKIPSTYTKDGYNYKITQLNKASLGKAKKLKTIKVTGKYLKKVDKKVFKGLKKSQIKKIKVKITKKNPNYKSLKKQFANAGVKKSNIKFY
jgi:hypothetical protein